MIEEEEKDWPSNIGSELGCQLRCSALGLESRDPWLRSHGYYGLQELEFFKGKGCPTNEHVSSFVFIIWLFLQENVYANVSWFQRGTIYLGSTQLWSSMLVYHSELYSRMSNKANKGTNWKGLPLTPTRCLRWADLASSHLGRDFWLSVRLELPR